jgi:NAD(P)-dependent dehydrogenase (short-subunit alcohol dehydrogenase family)
MNKISHKLTDQPYIIGINLAFAELLLGNGCNVVIADLGLRPEAQAIVNKFNGRSGTARAIFQKTDVTDWVQLEELFKVTEREFTEIDIVCPGAGVYEEVCIHIQLQMEDSLISS